MSGAPCRIYTGPSAYIMVVDYTNHQIGILPPHMEVHTFTQDPPRWDSDQGRYSEPNTSGPDNQWSNSSSSNLIITPVASGLHVSGELLGHQYDITFEHGSLMSPNQAPPDTVDTITETSKKKVITTHYEEANDDIDGWRRIRQEDVYKPGATEGSWTLVSSETNVYLTPLSGQEVLVEHTDAKGVTTYEYWPAPGSETVINVVSASLGCC